MIKIAHASRLEKAKLTLKKAKAARRKRKHQFNVLDEEEKKEILKRRNARDIKQEAKLIVWDHRNNCIPKVRQKRSIKILNERLEEIYSVYGKSIPEHLFQEIEDLLQTIKEIEK